MDSQYQSDSAPEKTEDETPSPIRMNPAVEGRDVASKTAQPANDSKKKPDSVTKREFRLFEIVSLGLNAGLLIVGAIALHVYSGQLSVMRGTLGEMKRSGESTTEQIWRAIDNINWLARSADLSQKTAQVASGLSAKQAREALDASIAASETDQRAWVGLQEWRCDHCSKDRNTKFIGAVVATITNTGRTPAADLSIERCLYSVQETNMEEPIPDIAVAMHPAQRPKGGGVVVCGPLGAAEVIAPGVSKVLTLTPFSLPIGDKDNDVLVMDHRVTAFVQVTYRIVGDTKPHLTTFCLINRWGMGTDFALCPKNQVMN